MDKITLVNGQTFKNILKNGALDLKSNSELVNDLNVFPVPDGDTGTNMCMTLSNGLSYIEENNDSSIEVIARQLSRGMLLGARGNSGVILSQIFRGIANGLDGKSEVDAKGLAEAFMCGVKQAYAVVKKPVEGTILTVAREASEKALSNVKEDTTIQDYLLDHLKQAEETLSRTPEMLEVLKKANVIDSGGAGYVYIIEGMYKALNNEAIEEVSLDVKKHSEKKAFGPDSELEFGYCTEFILQLQNKKVDIKSFDVEEITSFLETIGDSIVSLKDDDVVKVHVHTMDPGKVLSYCRKFGEYVSVKIENMALQHNEITEKKEHKKYGVVSVANGAGLTKVFKELGSDYVINGGQTMNPPTEDFIKAFESIDADSILVFPNNDNIVMAANQAATIYTQSNIVVIPTKTMAQGYSALSMLNLEDDDMIEILHETIDNVITGQVTYAIRDANLDGIQVKKNDYMGIANKKIKCACSDKFTALKELIDAVMKEEREVITIIFGKDVEEKELDDIVKELKEKYRYAEIGLINGGQDVYSFIISFE